MQQQILPDQICLGILVSLPVWPTYSNICGYKSDKTLRCNLIDIRRCWFPRFRVSHLKRARCVRWSTRWCNIPNKENPRSFISMRIGDLSLIPLLRYRDNATIWMIFMNKLVSCCIIKERLQSKLSPFAVRRWTIHLLAWTRSVIVISRLWAYSSCLLASVGTSYIGQLICDISCVDLANCLHYEVGNRMNYFVEHYIGVKLARLLCSEVSLPLKLQCIYSMTAPPVAELRFVHSIAEEQLTISLGRRGYYWAVRLATLHIGS